jgi:23S rRNA pseudouridine2605 synthase
MRLSKFLAHSGVCSRRGSEKLIKENKVIINNNICNDFSYQVKKNDLVFVDGKKVSYQKEIELYILNKPRGYITSRKDELNRNTVYDLLPQNKKHLISIGRLDYNTEGLLLFTNNGDYARYYELPKNKIKRTYRVKVYGELNDSDIKKIKNGITIRGVKHNVDEIKLIKKLKKNNWFEICLKEGKNREIRKIFESFNIVVNRIIRTNYGEFFLKGLKNGEFRKIKIN